MIKINCIICDDTIEKPRVDQLSCNKKSCKDEFNSNMVELWKLENPDKVKDMNKKAYENKNDGVQSISVTTTK